MAAELVNRSTERGRRTLSVVSVTYESAPLIADALGTACASAADAGWDVEIIVVDNASSDGSADVVRRAFPSASIIANERNVGFGAANNQAFDIATGEYWLLLNPDAELDVDAIRHLTAFLEAHDDAAAVGPSIASAGGHRAESSGMAPSIRSMLGHFLFVNRLLPGELGGQWRGFQLTRREGAAPREVDWVGGMAVLLRPEAVRMVGGFDPSIFLYAEDVDLGLRLRAAGWRLWLEPKARGRHRIAASQGGVSSAWVDALHRVYSQHSGRAATVTMDGILFAGLSLRALVAAATSPHDAVHRRRMVTAARRAARVLTSSARGG